MKFEEGKVYVNKVGEYCQIKELTRWNDGQNNLAYIVCSDSCTFSTDATTNIVRQVFTAKKFVEDWEEVKEKDDWNLMNYNANRTERFPITKEKMVLFESVEKLKAKILKDIDINWTKELILTGKLTKQLITEIINKRFGF